MQRKNYPPSARLHQLRGGEAYSKKSSVSKRKSAGDRPRGNGTPRRARRTHVRSPRLASPRLAPPRHASRARTPLRSRSQSARLTFFLHVLFPRLYPVSQVEPIAASVRRSSPRIRRRRRSAPRRWKNSARWRASDADSTPHANYVSLRENLH